MNRLLSCLLAGAFFCCTGVHALEYRLVNVVDTTMASPSGGFFTDFFEVSIDGSAVAFLATETAIVQGVFTAIGGKLTTIVKYKEPGLGNVLGGFNHLDISGDTVAFHSFTGNQSITGIFSGNGGPLTTIAKDRDTFDGRLFFVPYDLSFDRNTVVFTPLFAGGTSGILGSINGSLSTIAAPGDPAPFGVFVRMNHPKLSGNTLAFKGVSELNYEYVEGIFTKSNGEIQTIVKLGDPAPSGFFEYVSDLSLSCDTAAFSGSYENGIGIFAGSGGPLTTIVKVFDPAPVGEFWQVRQPVISGSKVAFLGFYADEFNQGGHGIFIGNGGPLTSVIQTGDALFGSTVTALFYNDFFNSLERGIAIDRHGDGALAFRYELADGRIGIAMGIPVPEPIGLEIVVLMASFSFRHRRPTNTDGQRARFLF